MKFYFCVSRVSCFHQSVYVSLYVFLPLFLIQCVCACYVTPGPAANWVSPSFSILSLNATTHTLPPSPPPTSLHRCLSVALSTAWSVPLSAGCMVVLSKAACNQWGWRFFLILFDHWQLMGRVLTHNPALAGTHCYLLMLELKFSFFTVSLIPDCGFKWHG